MPSLTSRLNLPGSLAAARALLADPASFLCFPGLSRPPIAEAAWFEHDVDLPILGRQAQTVVLAVDEAPAEPGSACIVFSVSGALVSVSGRWRLENGAAGVRAELALECRVAEDVRRRAVDAYRSRSPLPIRTDADAILTRLVDDLFHEKLEQDAAIYRRLIAALLEPRGAA